MINKKSVIFDLDGTLALIEERRKISSLPSGKINWDVFFDPQNIRLDKPNVPVIATLQAMKEKGYVIVVFSGRSDRTKDATIEWLKSHSILPNVLKMRPEGDFTADDILKKQWVADLFPNKEDILCVFDDRDKVVKMWRNQGISCFQVAEGNF